MARFRLARAAADDLVAIFLDGLEQFGLLQADAYHEGLGAIFAFLRIIPIPRACARTSRRLFACIPTMPISSSMISEIRARLLSCAFGTGEKIGYRHHTTDRCGDWNFPEYLFHC